MPYFTKKQYDKIVSLCDIGQFIDPEPGSIQSKPGYAMAMGLMARALNDWEQGRE